MTRVSTASWKASRDVERAAKEAFEHAGLGTDPAALQTLALPVHQPRAIAPCDAGRATYPPVVF